MNDTTNQTQTRAYQNGIRAAKGVRWASKKLKMLDKACVASVKRKKWQGWMGHIPLISMALAIIALLVYFSLEILFTVGFLVILFSVAENIGSGSVTSDDLSSDNIFSSLTDSEDDYGSVYMHGNQGDGWYTDDSGTIKLDD